jgi:hypothetical protein
MKAAIMTIGVFWGIAPYSVELTALMMEAVSTSKPSISFYVTTRSNIKENKHLRAPTAK